LAHLLSDLRVAGNISCFFNVGLFIDGSILLITCGPSLRPFAFWPHEKTRRNYGGGEITIVETDDPRCDAAGRREINRLATPIGGGPLAK
jgi:hypothetical protein